MFSFHLLLPVVYFFLVSLSFVYSFRCPGTLIDLEINQGSTPYGNSSAGTFIPRGKLKLLDCVKLCCASSVCNIVFHYDEQCLLVECVSDQMCEPLLRSGEKFKHYYVVVVRSTGDSIATSDLSARGIGQEYGRYLDYPFESDALQDTNTMMRRRGNVLNPVRPIPSKVCELGIVGDCPEGETCAPKNSRARQGVCVCPQAGGYIRNVKTGHCVRIASTSQQSVIASDDYTHLTDDTTHSLAVTKIESNASASTTNVGSTTTVRHLVVSAGDDKVIQLPENSGSLSAFAVPKESESGMYKYEWTLVSHPEGDQNGSMSDKNSPTVKFSGLKEGLYTFKVTVSSDVVSGEAFVNVTVLSPKRVNKPPIAAINPVIQTVKLPNTDVVLDGSASSDDDKIVSYVWGVDTAPIDYKPKLSETATLQLKNLIPGFYRFMLTVTDSDGVKNSTYANVTIIKETDYPPTANAGPDAIIYLPRKELTLNGSLSTDDKGIKSWEWTKGADTDKAVDMQYTRTPLLHLSNLEVGMYTFILRVTDTAEQSSTAQVHVFVKPGNEGPYANAGEDQEVLLPISSVTLDGSKSHDDVDITRWEWKQVSGPAQSLLNDGDKSKAVASKLTKGVYVFQLTVYNKNMVSSSNTTTVTIKQSKNNPPKANAGGDRTIELPANLVILNGSESSDDVGVVSFSWTRESSSLAAGEILEGSEHLPLLMLTELVPGRYLFRLTVSDAEGVSDFDTASIIVKPSRNEKDDVEMNIASDIYSFTEEQKVTLAKKLALLLQEDVETTVVITKVLMEKNTNRVFLVFHAEKILSNGHIAVERGPDVVHALKQRLDLDGDLLSIPVISIETAVCQNNCSDHGSCDQFTKQCICEAFWMQDVIRLYFGDKETNCDWSILYVIIILFTIAVLFGAMMWSFVCFCNRSKKSRSLLSSSKLRLPRSRRRQQQRYTLLDHSSSDREVKNMLLKNKLQNNSVMISDSDLESETIFDKSYGMKGGHELVTNGFAKLPDEGNTRSPAKVRT